MTRIDALAAIGLAAIFAGLWWVWPAFAIIVVGVCLLGIAVGMAVLRQRARDAGGSHED